MKEETKNRLSKGKTNKRKQITTCLCAQTCGTGNPSYLPTFYECFFCLKTLLMQTFYLRFQKPLFKEPIPCFTIVLVFLKCELIIWESIFRVCIYSIQRRKPVHLTYGQLRQIKSKANCEGQLYSLKKVPIQFF